MWMWLLASAWAGDLNFSPDRPGVGNSTGTVGAGAVMVEGGVAATVAQPSAVGTSSIIGRFGVDDGVELRVRAPDIVLYDGEVGTGFVGLGAKIGGNVSERWSVSVVPEIAVDTNGGGFFGLINGQAAVALGDVGMWVTSESVVGDFGSGTTAGGGVSVAISGGGVYANAGGTFGGDPFVGGGGWWALQEAVQLDIGCDVWVGDDVVPVFLLGASFGF
jgi:hypothetical protein